MVDWLSHMCLMEGGENRYIFRMRVKTAKVAMFPHISARLQGYTQK
jgi:hypothetical protein